MAGNSSTAAGYWGDYNCDVPLHTLVNLMEHLTSIKDQVGASAPPKREREYLIFTCMYSSSTGFT